MVGSNGERTINGVAALREGMPKFVVNGNHALHTRSDHRMEFKQVRR